MANAGDQRRKKKGDNATLYMWLTRLFRSTPTIRRKIRSIDTTVAVADRTRSNGYALFQRTQNPTYSMLPSSGYDMAQRLTRYQEYQDMETMPEISSALDIWADESCASDDKGRVLHVFSENERIKEVLEDLFYNIVNTEFNLRPWMRNLVKNGDLVLFLDVVAGLGVQNVVPIPVNEIEREENYDPDNPFAVRFKFISRNRYMENWEIAHVRFKFISRNRYMENWEIAHVRLLGNDAFLPYGTSVNEGARRIWRQLILAEDAMLVYRVTRAPDRRVFYLDVGNLAPDEIKHYIEEQKQLLRNSSIIDQNTGRVDLRYNSLCLSLKTPIKLQDGRVIPLHDLIDEWNSGKCDQHVYSIDLDTKRIVPGKVAWAGITQRDAELVRVHLDDGTYVDTTPDHRFMLRDGEYAPARDLQPGQSLMPLYVKKTRKEDGHRIEGYEKIYDPFRDEYVLTHRNNVIVTQGFDAIVGNVVHHIDFDKTNNDPSNLQCMTWHEHCVYHGQHAAELSRMPASRERSRRTMMRSWQRGSLNSSLYVDLWRKPKVRDARVRALTLQFDHGFFIERCYAVLDSFGPTKRVKEAEFIAALNEDAALQQHITDRNQNFKNGFIGKWSRGGLQSKLKALGFEKSIMSLQQGWLLQRYDLEEIKRFCASKNGCRRKDVLKKFNLSRYSLEELIRLSGESVRDFRAQHMPGNARYQRKKLNHKVVSVERLQHREDVGCITVEGVHNFAVGASSACSEEHVQSYVIVHNSIEEDFFLPRRNKESATEIQNLAGGQNVAAIEDVAYLQKKLFSALKVPKVFLNFDEALSCLIGSTRVAMLDGTTATMEFLASLDWDAHHHDVWVHSCDPSTGRIVPGRVVRAWITKRVDRLHRITLDSDNVIECTDNHPFLCRDGEYRRADELSVGQSLMPLYRRLSCGRKRGGDDLIDGYEMVLDNDDGEWKYTHKVVHDVKCNGEHKIKKQRVIHHRDFNKRNNDPANLDEMTWHEHRRLHAHALESTLLRPDVVERRRVEQLKWVKSEEHREFKRAFMKQHLRENPDHPFLQDRSARMKIQSPMMWADPEFHARACERSKRLWDDPEYRSRYMGDNNWTRRKNAAYDIDWLRQFCAQHNVTSINQWRGDYRDSVREICPFGSGHVQRLLEENGFSSWKEFKRTIPYADQALSTKRFSSGYVNHKIVSIDIIDLEEPIAVYDLEVEKHHNFAVSGGGCRGELDGFIFVHNSKAGAAAQDIRFSRSVAIVQKTFIAELNKIAAVHLAALGFGMDDLVNFTLRLSNPSTIAQQQKLELWRTRLEIAANAPEAVVSRGFLRREVFGLTDRQSKELDDERLAEKIVDSTIEGATVAGPGEGEGDEGPAGAGGSSDELTPDLSAAAAEAGAGEEGDEQGVDAAGDEEPEQQNASVEPEEDDEPELELLTSADDPERPPTRLSVRKDALPVNVAKHIDRMKYNRSRIRHHGAASTGMPDLARMTGNGAPEMSDPYDSRYLRSIATNPFGESTVMHRLPPDLESVVGNVPGFAGRGVTMLSEAISDEGEHHLFTLVDDDEGNDGR